MTQQREGYRPAGRPAKRKQHGCVGTLFVLLLRRCTQIVSGVGICPHCSFQFIESWCSLNNSINNNILTTTSHKPIHPPIHARAPQILAEAEALRQELGSKTQCMQVFNSCMGWDWMFLPFLYLVVSSNQHRCVHKSFLCFRSFSYLMPLPLMHD